MQKIHITSSTIKKAYDAYYSEYAKDNWPVEDKTILYKSAIACFQSGSNPSYWNALTTGLRIGK